MKRALLLILTNLAILAMLSFTCAVLGVNQYLTASGLGLGTLLVFCSILGFGGAFVSLLLSRPIAKWTTGARVVDGNENAEKRWLVSAVARLSQRAGITMPEVAIYEGAPNAFATGASKHRALIAVSTGLLQSMTKPEVEAVLAHEVAHAASSDITGLTLIQGVVNTFVMFLARVIGLAVDRGVLRNDSSAPGLAYSVTVVVLELALGFLASIVVATYSRHREYAADAGAAALLGSPAAMVQALQRLQQLQGGELPKSMQAFGIAAMPQVWALFATHPPLADRIAALQRPAV